MKKKIVRTKKNTWKLRNKWDVQDWVALILLVMVSAIALIQVLR